ncbi:hypothetical protein M9435_004465 [Picochlorum sp. BPE23]|nr:hypothetical protein M9435_004465 [Picochlorum sp. BPE23]
MGCIQSLPLRQAVREEDHDRVVYLLKNNQKAQKMALIMAVQADSVDMVRLLLKYGVEINMRDKAGQTALMHAVVPRSEKMFKRQKQVKKMIDKQSESEGDRDSLLSSIKSIVSDFKSECSHSRHWDHNHTEICKLLLENGVDVNLVDHEGCSALIHATAFGNLEGYANIAKSLIDANADPNIANTDGNTALMWAANKGFANIAKFLVDAKADLNIVNRYGNSALHVALGSNSAHIAEIILSSGENVNIDSVNNQGKTPLFYARLYRYESVTQTLIRLGANQALAELLIQREGAGHHEPSSEDSGFDSVYKGVRTVYRGVRLRNMLDSISEFDV